jgi:hypothetical protein
MRTAGCGVGWGSEWLDGKCTGNGTTTFKSGSRYVGVYHEDKMNGHGAAGPACAVWLTAVGPRAWIWVRVRGRAQCVCLGLESVRIMTR